VTEGLTQHSEVAAWIEAEVVRVLNVAGNREVRRITFSHIPSEGGRLSGIESGSAGSPTVERHEGPEHAGEAGGVDVSGYPVLRGPRGTAKARLLELQSRSGHLPPRRQTDYRDAIGSRPTSPGGRETRPMGYRVLNPGVEMSGGPNPC
jgi:hypothetical protein